MKKLILLLFLLPLFAGAQTYQSMPQAGYGPLKRMLFDSVLTLPLGITKLQNISGGRDVGQIRYNVLDSSLYTYSGTRWIKSGIDTSTIYYNLGLKLNISDTAPMMAAAPRIQRFLDSVTNLKTSINLKLNIADSSTMLAPYSRATQTALKLNISDTASMLSPYTRLAANALKLNIADTAAMMEAAPRVQRFLDSVANLKTSISTKLNIADTTNKFITSVFRKTASDSVFFVKGGANNFAYKDSTGGGNIYTQNGSLTSNRTLTLNSQPLTFLGTTRTRFHANGRMTIGDTTDAGFRLDVRGEDASINGLRIGLGNGQSTTNTILGLNALTVNSASYHIAIGANALAANTTGNGNVAIGYNALKTANTKGDQVAIGYEAMGLANSEGSIGIGSNALRRATGINNLAIGTNASTVNVAGRDNTTIGWGASVANTSGSYSTIVGSNAYRANTTGGGSTYVGWSAGKSGTANCGLGAEVLYNSTGDNNVGMGNKAGYNITTGSGNITLGHYAGQYLTTQSNHIIISSLVNNTLAEDQARAAFYVQQNSTTTSQIVTLNGNVAINTIAPSATAVMDLTSTTKGFLPPRMTTTQINAISSPAVGLIVYNTTLNVLCVYTGTWQKMTTTAM